MYDRVKSVLDLLTPCIPFSATFAAALDYLQKVRFGVRRLLTVRYDRVPLGREKLSANTEHIPGGDCQHSTVLYVVVLYCRYSSGESE
jgi:hypothetical protein